MRTNGSVFERECNGWNVVGCKVTNTLARDAALLSKAIKVSVRKKWEERDTVDLTQHND